MRSSSSLLGRTLFWIAYGSTSKLESSIKSLTRIRVLRVFRGFFGVASQEIFGGNLFKEVAYARNNLKFREAANKIF